MYRRMHQHDRINEQDVPESQHTIFIRGLSGTVTTAGIKEFFEKEFGSCSFDFIKLSRDREKLHVAVRFDSKTAARQCMDKYKDGELFGHPVQLTWFRDIRRYLNHIQKQGRSRFRRFDDDRRRNFARDDEKSRSRSRSRSSSRGSKSPEKNSLNLLQDRSRSPGSPMSEHSSYDEVKRELTPSPEPPRKSRKSKKDKKRKRKHDSVSRSRSHSPINNNECISPRKKERAPSVSDMETSDGELQKSELSFNTASDFQKKNVFASGIGISSATTANILKNTSFALDLESNNPPRQIVRKSYAEEEKYENVSKPYDYNKNQKSSRFHSVQSNANGSANAKKGFLSVTSTKAEVNEYLSPDRADNDTVNQLIKKEANNSAKKSQDSVDMSTGRKSPLVNNPPPPVFNEAMTNFKTIQRLILQDVRYKPSESNEEDNIGNYRLSSLSTQKTADAIREEKLAKLSQDLRDKVERKKLQLELSYRRDCETFGLMTRKLIGKDRSLEERLRLALLEIMKDLEQEAMHNLDDYIDQMIFLTA